MTRLILPPAVAKFKAEQQEISPSIKVDNIVVTGIDTVKGCIVQSVYAVMDDELIDTMVMIVELQDQHVMNALITLGWTPPDEPPPTEIP